MFQRACSAAPRVGVVVSHIDGALDADLERLRRLDLGHDPVEEAAELRHPFDGHAKPPVSTLKPRRTAPSTESGLCAVIQIGGRGFWTG